MSEYPKVFRNGKLVSKYEAEPRYEKNAAPNVISDNMDGLKHHGTGKITDSKSEFRKMTRAAGCIEMGNDSLPARKPIPLDRRQRREDIKRTIYDLRNR